MSSWEEAAALPFGRSVNSMLILHLPVPRPRCHSSAHGLGPQVSGVVTFIMFHLHDMDPLLHGEELGRTQWNTKAHWYTSQRGSSSHIPVAWADPWFPSSRGPFRRKAEQSFLPPPLRACGEGPMGGRGTTPFRQKETAELSNHEASPFFGSGIAPARLDHGLLGHQEKESKTRGWTMAWPPNERETTKKRVLVSEYDLLDSNNASIKVVPADRGKLFFASMARGAMDLAMKAPSRGIRGARRSARNSAYNTRSPSNWCPIGLNSVPLFRVILGLSLACSQKVEPWLARSPSLVPFLAPFLVWRVPNY